MLFDMEGDVLGAFNTICRSVSTRRSIGRETGVLADGTTIPLARPPDLVPNGGYGPTAQQTMIDGGRMDGFSKVGSCNQSTSYRHRAAPLDPGGPKARVAGQHRCPEGRSCEDNPDHPW